jgi:hypothetical protein
MSELTTSPDALNFLEDEGKKIPSSLNTLTILTFIGCAIGMIFTLASPFIMNFSKQMLDKANAMDNLSDKQLADMQKAKTAIEIAQQNIVPIMIISIIGIALCFTGATWMRKLKKDGYWLYVAGELLPLIGGFIFMGKYQFIDWKSYLNILLPLVFVMLYAMQLKYLVK